MQTEEKTLDSIVDSTLDQIVDSTTEIGIQVEPLETYTQPIDSIANIPNLDYPVMEPTLISSIPET